ncbi:3-oxoacyl-ACP reductase FabG [Candidatus Pacebacteria bacterium]|nr:3-oxoacyl-ACP reductase FabG [Candidatus Paceibacterota bacterium]
MENKFDLTKHKALITGGSRGIGAATAKMLSSFGAKVFINYTENKKEAQKISDSIIQSGGSASIVCADVSKLEQVESMSNEIGKITLLVNNAGRIIQPSSWDKISDDDFDKTIATNLKGTFNCTKVFAPHMFDNEHGKIINISSTYGFMGAAPVIAYTASKAGVINLTKSFAKEFAPKINVNCICPGIIDTDMTKAAGEELIKQSIEETPLRRLGKAEEIASSVCYLASDLANFITGEVFVIDGGHSLR